ncbi:MAG: hypothetical protein VW239_07070 [Candidatus Nanopelagicales bacterium]
MVEIESPHQSLAVTSGELDVQIRTAKSYPRSIRTFLQDAKAMATLDAETAAGCFYSLPRDGKNIQGPSARLAEICAAAWGHIRVQARVVGEEDRFVVARGEAWDVQTNVAIAYEVKRRIVDRRGNRYSDDMIAVTSNAACSIALRNAVFKVIPRGVWKPIYDAACHAAVGDAKTLDQRRQSMLKTFKDEFQVRPEQLYTALEVKGLEDVTLDHLATALGMLTALRDGEMKVETMFPPKVLPKESMKTPKGFTEFVEALGMAARKGVLALEQAFGLGTETQRTYLTLHQSETWARLREQAMSAGTTAPANELPL